MEASSLNKRQKIKNGKPLNILIIGPPGSGKGTQAKMLAKKYGLKHLQSGKICRKWAREKIKFGREVYNALLKGFVPSEWIFKMTKEELEKVDKKQGLMLDSFSKLLPEIKMLYEILSKHGRKLDYIFLIKVSDKETFRRLSNRGTCQRCEKVFVLRENKKTICSTCNLEVEKRDDDNWESVKKRLKDHKTKTSKVIEYINKNDKLIKINGHQPIKKVFEDIIKYIK